MSIFLVLVNFFFFLPYLINPDGLTTLDNDLGRTYIPLYSFIADSIKTYGQIPLWRPDQMMGDTAIGNPLSSLLYPPNLMFIFLPADLGAIVYLYLHFLLALVATYYLAKTFGFSKSSAFAAAVFYGFSTKMLVHLEAGHITMIAAFSYLPLLFLSVREIFKKTRFFYMTTGAVALTFMYITYPTIFLYAAIFTGVYILYRITFGESKKKLLPFIFLTTVAAGLVAATLLPQLEYGKYSTRSQLKYEDVAIPLWNREKFMTSLVFPYQSVNGLDHESFLYLGAVPIIFGALGFLYLEKRKKLFLVALSILTLLFIAGESTPVFRIAYDLFPPLQYTRVTTRPWFVVALLAALLAAYGLGRIKNQKIVFLAIIIFLTESFFIFTKRLENIKSLNFDNEDIYQFLANDKDFFRVYCTTYCFNPQLLSKYKIEQLAGETPIQNANFVKFLATAGNYRYDSFAVIFPPYQIWQVEKPPVPDSLTLGSANVKYVASTDDIKSEKFKFIKKFGNLFLFENKDFKQRFFFERDTDRISILNYTPNTQDLNFPKSANWRDLVISQNYYPGWYAYMDGRKYPIEVYEQFFQKVSVLPNTESVQIRYEPPSLLAGKTITIGTILFLLMYFWYTRRKSSTNNHGAG